MEHTRNLISAFRQNRDYKKYATIAVQTAGMTDELIELCKTTEYPFPQYSSWLLSHIAGNHYDFLQAYQTKIIDVFLTATDHSTVRNLGNVLLKYPKIDYREGELLDILFRFLQDSDTKVALKAYSMYLITGFLKDYPELKNEFKSIIEEGMQKESAAYAGAVKKTLKLLDKM